MSDSSSISEELFPSEKSSPETGNEENKKKLSSTSGSSISEEILETDSDKSGCSVAEEILSDKSSEETGSDNSQEKSREGIASVKSNNDSASSESLKTNKNVSDISLIPGDGIESVKFNNDPASLQANQNVSDISLMSGENNVSETPSQAATSTSSLGILAHLINLDNEVHIDEIDCYNTKKVLEVDKSIDALCLGSSTNPESWKTITDFYNTAFVDKAGISDLRSLDTSSLSDECHESADSSVLKGKLIEPDETLISATQESKNQELGLTYEKFFASNDEATDKQMTANCDIIEALPSFKNIFPTYCSKFSSTSNENLYHSLSSDIPKLIMKTINDEENLEKEEGMIKTPNEEKKCEHMSGEVIQLTEGELADGNILDSNVPMQKEMKIMHISEAFEDEFKILNISKSENDKVKTLDTTFVKEEETDEKVAEAKTKLYLKEPCENVKYSKPLSKAEIKVFNFVDLNAQWLNEKFDKRGQKIEKKTENMKERVLEKNKANEIVQGKKQPGQHFTGPFESWVITPSNDEVYEGRRAGFTFDSTGKPVKIEARKSKIPCWEKKYVSRSSKTKTESSAADLKSSKKNDDYPNSSRVEMARKVYSQEVAVRNKMLLKRPGAATSRIEKESQTQAVKASSSPENIRNLIKEEKTGSKVPKPDVASDPPKPSSVIKRKSFIPILKLAAPHLPKVAKNPTEGVLPSMVISDDSKKALAQRRALARIYTRKLHRPTDTRRLHPASASRHSGVVQESVAIDSGIPQSQHIVGALLAPRKRRKPKDTCPFIYKGN